MKNLLPKVGQYFKANLHTHTNISDGAPSPEEMKAAVMQYAVGDTVTTIIYRSGQQYQVELTLTEDKG